MPPHKPDYIRTVCNPLRGQFPVYVCHTCSFRNLNLGSVMILGQPQSDLQILPAPPIESHQGALAVNFAHFSAASW